jgi:hypothetical protein
MCRNGSPRVRVPGDNAPHVCRIADRHAHAPTPSAHAYASASADTRLGGLITSESSRTVAQAGEAVSIAARDMTPGRGAEKPVRQGQRSERQTHDRIHERIGVVLVALWRPLVEA